MHKINSCFDLTGQKIGHWTVISQVPCPSHWNSNSTQAFWLCECECGHKSVVRGYNLRHGKSRSCGCQMIYNNVKNKTL